MPPIPNLQQELLHTTAGSYSMVTLSSSSAESQHSTLHPECARRGSRRRALGQYFTPPEVAAFVLRAVRAAAGSTLGRQASVIDPACGEGVFLLAAMEQKWLECSCVVGLDVDTRMEERWRASGLQARATLLIADGLLDLPEDDITTGAFDLVVGNPPYGGAGLHAPGDVEARFRAVLEQYECWRLGTAWEGQRGLEYALTGTVRPRAARRRLERFPVELLFVERFLQLARPEGWLAIVLPDGTLANPHLQPFRDWLLPRMTPRAVVSLPRAIFDGAGSHTAILVGQKAMGVRRWALGVGRWALGVENCESGATPPEAASVNVRMTAPASSAAMDLAGYLEEAARHLAASEPPIDHPEAPAPLQAPTSQPPNTSTSQRPTPNAQHPTPNAQRPTPNAPFAGSVVVARQSMLRAAPVAAELWGRPWSPQYWDPDVAEVLQRLERTAFSLEPLGRRDENGGDVGFLRYTTYGAVGARLFQPAGVRYLTTRNLTPTGVDLPRQQLFVAADGRNDPPRSRLRAGDILLSNSGVASLGRPALFLAGGDCNISQHLNLIRVAGIDACYVTAYLHTEFGRAQMRRLHSGTGAAGLSYDDIRAIRIPVLPPRDQEEIRQAFLGMHTAHEEAMAIGAENRGGDAERISAEYQRRIAQARDLLAALIAALEAYIEAPGASGLTIDRGSVSTSGPLRLTATVCSE